MKVSSTVLKTSGRGDPLAEFNQYQNQGRYAEAEPLYLRCLAILDAALGPDHPNTQAGHRNYELLLQARAAAR